MPVGAIYTGLCGPVSIHGIYTHAQRTNENVADGDERGGEGERKKPTSDAVRATGHEYIEHHSDGLLLRPLDISSAVSYPQVRAAGRAP